MSRLNSTNAGAQSQPEAAAAFDDAPLLPGVPDPKARQKRSAPRGRNAKKAAGYGPLLVAAGMVLAGVTVIGAVALPLLGSPAPTVPAGAVAAPTQTPSPAPIAPTAIDAPTETEADTKSKSIALLADSQWVGHTAKTTGIPPRALAAYSGAAIRVREELPECGLGWNTLAGIGWVESEHGTLHGGHIAGNGDTKPPIYGVPLSGQHGTEQLPDTDGGALDGDGQWDRAMGPLQFVPDTWAQWGADGNGDGVSDPQQLDDAALAAARYLCHVGGDLTVPENWIAAVGAYNSPVDYINRVAAAANAYGQS